MAGVCEERTGGEGGGMHTLILVLLVPLVVRSLTEELGVQPPVVSLNLQIHPPRIDIPILHQLLLLPIQRTVFNFVVKCV